MKPGWRREKKLPIAYSKYTVPYDELIVDALRPFSLLPTPRQCEQIRLYLALLLRWNEKINLTTIRDLQEILTRHFGESLFGATQVPDRPALLVDVGSGAGFPGLALKIARPQLQVVLLEPVNKKAAFLAEVARLLGLAGVRVITKQFEHYELPEHIADFITARGIRPGSDLLSWARCTLRSGGKLVLWLGRKDAEHLAAVAGWTWMPPAQIPTSDNRFLLSGIPA